MTTEDFWSDLASLLVRASKASFSGQRAFICIQSEAPILQLEQVIVRLAPRGAILVETFSTSTSGVFVAGIDIPAAGRVSEQIKDLSSDPIVAAVLEVLPAR